MKLLFAVLALSASLSAADPVAVYVTSAGAANGFTDPSKDNRDTVKDLRDSLKDAKEVRLVESPSEAQIVLTVQGRQVNDIPSSSVFGGSDSDQKRTIRVMLQAGTYETTLEASGYLGTFGTAGGFKKAAGKIAKQVREWIAANRASLSANP
jgi:hypothetical protein